MLEWILIKGWEIVNNFGYISIILLVGLAQIVGFPTEISLPMIFKRYKGILPIILAGISDFLSFAILFFLSKSFSFRFKRRFISRKEIILYRMIPIVRGGMVPIISFGHFFKDIFYIILATSFLWSFIFYLLSSFFDFWSFVDFVRENEIYFLVLLFFLFGYKGVRVLKSIFKGRSL